VAPSYALLAAIELDLFTTLKDGPMPSGTMAEALGVNQEKLEVLLYALVQTGLLSVTNQEFSNTPEATHFLIRGNADYLGGMYQAQPERWEAVLKTADSIRAGEAKAKVDYSAMSAQELESHYRGFYSATVARGRELLDRYDFSSAKRLLDVGGGTGGLAIALAEALPNLRATIVDLPSVAPVAQKPS
jgi:hypothetical protein